MSIIVLERDGGSIHKATITYWNSGIGVNVTGKWSDFSSRSHTPTNPKGKNNCRGRAGERREEERNGREGKGGKGRGGEGKGRVEKGKEEEGGWKGERGE